MTNTKELIDNCKQEIETFERPSAGNSIRMIHALEQLQAENEELRRGLEQEQSAHKTTYSLMLSGEKRGVEKGREESQEKINELAAHVHRLREVVTTGLKNKRGSALDVLNELDEIINETPQQSLAEHDAEVARRAIESFKDELVKSVNVMLRPHIEGVCAVVTEQYAQRTYGVKDGE